METDKLNFTAIDFETMTGDRLSACAVGLVRVEHGVIMQKFYSLIKPVPTEEKVINTQINGISKGMVENAPTFAKLWPILSNWIVNTTLVAHNVDFDADVLNLLINYYGLELNPMKEEWIDTYKMEFLKLEEACEKHHIEMGTHHDALCDATACAEYLLKMKGVELPTINPYFKKSLFGDNSPFKQARRLSSEAKRPLNPDEVENKETPFFQKKVVITGTFEAYPEREELAELLKKYGADINSSVSSKTNFLIVGEGAGPSKLKKVWDLIEKGNDIKVIKEDKLLEIINEFHIK